jgi:DNA repair protein RecO
MYNLHQTEGIILSSSDFSEADRFYTIYSRDFGKISVLAKGVRTEKSKLRGHLAPYSLARISFIEGKDHLRLTDAEEIWNSSRISEEKFYVLQRLSRLVDRLAQGPEKDEALWKFLSRAFLYFLNLNADSAAEDSVKDFESLFRARLLHRLGYVSLPEGVLGQAISGDNWPPAAEDNLNFNDFEKLFQKGLTESQL